MKSSPTVTFGGFHALLKSFATNIAPAYSGTLEEYLRSLLVEVEQHRADPPTLLLFAQIIGAALVTPPAGFDPAWREVSLSDSIANPANTPNGYDLARNVLIYQIASLRQLAESGQLNSQWRSLGLTLPDGHSWYNFTVSNFWEAAAAGLRENDMRRPGWAMLAVLFWLGQIYE